MDLNTLLFEPLNPKIVFKLYVCKSISLVSIPPNNKKNSLKSVFLIFNFEKM